MAIQEPAEFSTRAIFRDDLERNLTTLLKDAEQKVEGGSWDGVPVVTRKALDEALAAVFDAPLPPPSVVRVEVKTPATVVVSAECPKCHMASVIPAVITAVLEVDDTGGELKLKAKSKKRSHVCGQATLDDAIDGQTSFELDDIVCPFPGCSAKAEHEGDHVLDAATDDDSDDGPDDDAEDNPAGALLPS